MTSAFEESLYNFDLNFLHPSNNVVGDFRIDKQRKAILIAKRKTIATDSLIKKYYTNKEKLEQTEVLLITAKEECKQVCIDYKDTLEKCSQLEKDLKVLQTKNAELDKKYMMSQNQYEGMKSYANQLQLLVKEHESVIEGLKVQISSEKNNSDPSQIDKNISTLQKENKLLLSHLQLAKDIALGKKKIRKRHKVLLQRYDSSEKSTYSDDSLSESSSEEPDFSDGSPHSPFSIPEDPSRGTAAQKTVKLDKLHICLKQDSTTLKEDQDSDYSNEVVSEDTGRGSSLAFSDGEKCFNSPDYFHDDSSITLETGKIREKAAPNMCNSPKRTHNVVHVATSPLIFDDALLLSDNTALFQDDASANTREYFITDIPLSDEIVTIKEKRSLIDVATSPVKDMEKVNKATSPLVFDECDVISESNINTLSEVEHHTNDVENELRNDRDVREKTPVILIEETPALNGKHTKIDILSSHCELEISGRSINEKKCLERNNSKNVCDDNVNDCEIEMILNSMRLTQRLLTPIPKTPVKLQKNESKKTQNPLHGKSESRNGHAVCQDALLLRRENKALQTSVLDLKKEIIDIKCILKNHLLNNHDTLKRDTSNDIQDSVNTELFDDSSQETIFIYSNDSSSIHGEQNETDLDDLNDFRNQILSPVTETNENNCPLDSSGILIQKTTSTFDISKQFTSSDALESQKTSKESFDNCNRQTQCDNVNNDLTAETHEVITFEEDLRSEDEVDPVVKENNHVQVEILLEDKKAKILKSRKLSKLDKFKRKLLPKSKICVSESLPRKLRSKHKPKTIMRKNSHMTAAAILNDRSLYEKAAKVMAELKSNKNKPDKVTNIFNRTEEKDLAAKDVNKLIPVQSPKTTRETEKKVIAKPQIKENNSVIHEFNRKKIDTEIVTLENTVGLQYSEESSKLKNINKEVDPVHLPEINPEKLQSSRRETRQSIRQQDTNKEPVTKNSSPSDNFIRTTRSRSLKLSNDSISSVQIETKEIDETDKLKEKRKRLKRLSVDTPAVACKRVLRSSRSRDTVSQDDVKLSILKETMKIVPGTSDKLQTTEPSQDTNYLIINTHNNESHHTDRQSEEFVDQPSNQIAHPKESILCKMIERHARKDKSSSKRVPESISNTINKKLEENIAAIIEMPAAKAQASMDKLVEEVLSWGNKHFIAGLMKYLRDPERKRELFNKVSCSAAPPMSRSEQVLLYVARRAAALPALLEHLEYALFQLNRSPDFDVVETLAHFYALLCRYFGLKTRLRLFLLDAMYCLQFKVVPLVKQCLDVWMHILPLAHMGIAKCPLVTCLVYLLHFYKCEDRFNRVQEIRFILNRKYFYQFGDWNETKILEMFRTAIREMRDIPIEKKMLRMALIILGKRHGPKWCQKNIIKNMLMPLIERSETPAPVRRFCVSALGALLKPFPADMKVHFEITLNYLHDMLDHNPPDAMKEAIFTSLIYMSTHNANRVTIALLSWRPRRVSPEFERLLRDFVRVKPLGAWKKLLSRLTM